MDTVKLSGDPTAADNAEAMYDGTGYVDDTAPASRAQLDQIALTGAAINAAVALGIYKDHAEAVKEMVKVERVQEPNPKNTEIYNAIFRVYVKLIESHKKLWVEMHELMEGTLRQDK